MIAGLAQRLTPRFFRRIARDSGGVSALEFALVAPVVIALLVAILQTGVVFLYQQVLQSATTQAARLIMTGQAQAQNIGSSAFVADVCSDAGSMFDCSKLSANVQKFSSFSSMTQSNQVSGGTFTPSNNFDMGGPGDIVLVQVFYQLPVSGGPLGFTLANTSNGNAVLVATSVFRNEPYQN